MRSKKKKMMAAGVAACSLGALILTSSAASAAHPRATISLEGAGSTFVAPIMTGAWIPGYRAAHSDITIDYQGTGSGAGIALWTQGKLDFAGSDALLNAAQENAAKIQCGGGVAGGVFKIPVTIGAVSLIYNLPGVKNLKLSPAAIADIFLGNVTRWDAPQIKKLNPGVKLPSTAITVVHRSDGSGTTYIFTHYLAAVSKAWVSKLGKSAAGSTVPWPVGQAAKGSAGVAAAVGQTAGAISYVDLAYAVGNNLSYALVQNKAGKYVAPGVDSASAAADAFARSMPSDMQELIVNAPSAKAYPITGYSYIFMCTRQSGPKGRALVDFVRYIVTTGQTAARSRYYAPLPRSVQNLDVAHLDEIKK